MTSAFRPHDGERDTQQGVVALQSAASGADKLRLLLRKIVGEVAKRDEGAWELRVLSRELMAPTSLMDNMMKNQVMPKARLVTGLIADILGVPPTHPAVTPGLITTFCGWSNPAFRSATGRICRGCRTPIISCCATARLRTA